MLRLFCGAALAVLATCNVASAWHKHRMYYGAAPVGYGAPAYGAPVYGGPMYGAPAYGAPVYGGPMYGAPAYGAPVYGGPMYGAPVYGADGQIIRYILNTAGGVAFGPGFQLPTLNPGNPGGGQGQGNPLLPNRGQDNTADPAKPAAKDLTNRELGILLSTIIENQHLAKANKDLIPLPPQAEPHPSHTVLNRLKELNKDK